MKMNRQLHIFGIKFQENQTKWHCKGCKVTTINYIRVVLKNEGLFIEAMFGLK